MHHHGFLLLGGTGLLGRHLRKATAACLGPVWAPSRAELDLQDLSRAQEILSPGTPLRAVINAAALCDFAACEADPARSYHLNVAMPLAWARACAERGLPFVQFSSDYVFDGKTRTPYKENAPTAPLSVYGEHKAEMESRLREMPQVLLLRVSWLFGLGGRTFMSRLPDLLLRSSRLEVAAGKRGSCLHATAAAHWTVELLQQQRTGTFNLVHEGEVGWEDFAREILHIWREDGKLTTEPEIFLKPFTALAQGSGQRPAYSCLDPSKVSPLLHGGITHWKTGLRDFLQEWDENLLFNL